MVFLVGCPVNHPNILVLPAMCSPSSCGAAGGWHSTFPFGVGGIGGEMAEATVCDVALGNPHQNYSPYQG